MESNSCLCHGFSGGKGLAEADYTWVQCDLCNKWRELPKGHQVHAFGFTTRCLRFAAPHELCSVVILSVCGNSHETQALELHARIASRACLVQMQACAVLHGSVLDCACVAAGFRHSRLSMQHAWHQRSHSVLFTIQRVYRCTVLNTAYALHAIVQMQACNILFQLCTL